jgi:hypothetical protein
MPQENAESFTRWQTTTREHFTSTANLLLGLATGLLAFESALLLDARFLSQAAFWFAIAAVVFLFTSVGLALWCAINRLRDFRLTAQIARRRQEGRLSLQESREEGRSLGKFTWGLFWFQAGLFGVGAGCGAIAVVVQIWP